MRPFLPKGGGAVRSAGGPAAAPVFDRSGRSARLRDLRGPGGAAAKHD